MRSEREFEEWVRRRLADWPTPQILDFERWLRARGLVEFLPAVHEASRRRGIELEGVNGHDPRRTLIDHLVARIKRLVHARSRLQEDGASVVEIEAHTAEIERLRAELAEVVKESAA
jgi:hypothetical protein